MSRRHRGRPHHHAPGAIDAPRRGTTVESTGSATPEAGAHLAAAAAPPRLSSPPGQRGPGPQGPGRPPPALPPNDAAGQAPQTPEAPQSAGILAVAPIVLAPEPAAPGRPIADRTAQCTAPQLRRFIKSRPYVPMHELRRRFGIDGDDDDVTPVSLNPGRIYVGLPTHEGHLLGDLLRTGEVGYELSLDPRTPIVIGVYPMRPIPRG